MPFTFDVNGTERSDYVRYRSLQVRKDGGTESARLEFLDRDTRSATYQVSDGDTIKIRRDGGLEFGGQVTSVRVQKIDGTRNGMILTVVEAQGWRFEADDVVVTASFPSQALRTTAEALRVQFLAPKGWTSNQVTLGPVLPALTFTRQTLAQIYDELQKHSGWPWRVNGDKVMGFVEPGSLPAPVVFGETGTSVVLRGVSWARDRVRYASRVLVTTGGTGTVQHTDKHTGNGALLQFPLSVIPAEAKPPTQVIEGGTTHAIGAGRWTYDANDGSVRAATAVAAGAAVTVAYEIDLPATVRVQDNTSTRNADGSWNYAGVIDALLTAVDQTSIPQALAWASAELTARRLNPKRVDISTFVPGIYPWQRAQVSMPGHGADGQFLIQSTLLTSTGNKRDAVTTFTALEGDAIGRVWVEYFRERGGSAGGGSIATGGGAPGGGTGGGGSATLPAGTTFRLAGDNVTVYGVDATWRDCPQLCPTRLGAAGMAGLWTLRVPAYLLTAGTLQVRLLDQTTAGVLATVQTSQVGERLIGPFEFVSASFSAPLDVHDVLLQWRVTAGSNQAVLGHSVIYKS